MKFANYYKCSGCLLLTRHYVGEYTKVFLALKSHTVSRYTRKYNSIHKILPSLRIF